MLTENSPLLRQTILTSAFTLGLRLRRRSATRIVARIVSLSLVSLALLDGSGNVAWADETFWQGFVSGVPYASAAAYTPGVTLYGAVDEAIGFTKGAHTSMVQQSGGEWTSKIGLYGVEDLGSGYRASFALEGGFNASNGQLSSSNTLFNREAWVAIGSKNTGELKFGLQDTVGFPLIVDPYGAVATVSVFSYLVPWSADLGPGASYTPGRLPSAIRYSTPWFGPLNAQFAASLNSQSVGGPTVTTREVGFNYYDGHLLGSLSYFGTYALNTLTTSSYVRTDNFAAGVVYDKKGYALSAGYSFLAPRLTGDRVASVYTAGGIYKYAQRNDFRMVLVYRTVAGTNDHSLGTTLGYDYDLSKHTALYLRGSVIKNFGAAPKYAGYSSSAQPTVDSISNTYTGSNGALETYQAPHLVIVGMYHTF